MPLLEFRDPDGELRQRQFTEKLSVGRANENDLQLLDDLISKQHMEFYVRDGEVFALDVGSRNGTWLNGQRLKGEHKVGEGDVVKVGRLSLCLTSVEDVEHITGDLQSDPSVRGDNANPGPAHQRVSTSTETSVPDDNPNVAEEQNRERFQSDPTGFRRPKGTHVMLFDSDDSSKIQTKLHSNESSRFLPADKIHDDDLIRRDYEKLRIANELSRAISSELDLDQLLDRTINKALELFHAERGAILLYKPGTDELEPKAVANRNESESDEELRVSRTLIQQVTEEKSAILSSDAMMDQRFNRAHSIMLAGIRSIMLVPLLAEDELLGVIHLDSRVSSDVFTEKDLHLLSGFARQAANAIHYSRLVERRQKDMLARERLQRLLPAEVVEEVMQGERDLARGGELRTATVLFADIRGFTSLSERIEARKVVDLLNDYFEHMVEVVFEHGGALDKFVGDEIMAVWGAHVEVDDHPWMATSAALKMQERLASYNKARRAAGKIEVHMGIGINTGELVAGYMGSSRAMNYTVIGDVVNVAARLCSVAPADAVLVSEAVRDSVGSRVQFREEPEQNLRGKSESVAIYRALRTTSDL
jgi:adenylate cyclase